MSEQFSDWNAVRAQLEWPPKDRYVEAGLSDEDVRYYLQRAVQDIGALEEFGVMADDPRLDRVNELLRRIELGANIVRPSVQHSEHAEMLGGKLSSDEQKVLSEKISDLEVQLTAIIHAMTHHAGAQLGHRLEGLKLARDNEEREKREAAERARDAKITRLMIRKNKSRDEVIAELERDPFAGIDLERARELGLERVEIEGNAAAQNLMARIFDRTRKDALDITTANGRYVFVELWDKVCPEIPKPCISPQNFDYLVALQNGNIVRNLDIEKRKVLALPHFDRSESLFVMDFDEQDYNKGKALKEMRSKLFQELGIFGTGVVNSSVKEIDESLWIGDPSDMKKTPQHEVVITHLGLDPNHYNFRRIEQDEYARLAGQGKNFGKSKLLTRFNNYWIIGNFVYSLFGGHHAAGGPSLVGYGQRDHAVEHMAVRLVLECNK